MEKLLLIPGPSPVVSRILEVLARPTVSHVGPDMAADMRVLLENLKRIVFTTDGEPFVIAGAGTLAMEIAVLNLAAGNDRVLILSQGYFGDRMGQICTSFAIAHDLLQSRWGSVVSPDELSAALTGTRYDIVVCTHVDTATGACAPVREYARRVRQQSALFVVDGVCATGGIEERLDDWGIDVVLTAAQKCFGAPPGLAIDVFSARAMAKRRSLPSVPAYYSDILRWLPVMKDPGRYFSTPSVNEHRALAEATRMMLEEGMEARFARQSLFGRAIRSAWTELGFGLFTDADCRADTLSVVRYPEGVPDRGFRNSLAENGVVVAGGLGETAGHVFRMGHMGNLTASQILFAFEAVEKTLSGLGYGFVSGVSERAIRSVLEL